MKFFTASYIYFWIFCVGKLKSNLKEEGENSECGNGNGGKVLHINIVWTRCRSEINDVLVSGLTIFLKNCFIYSHVTER